MGRWRVKTEGDERRGQPRGNYSNDLRNEDKHTLCKQKAKKNHRKPRNEQNELVNEVLPEAQTDPQTQHSFQPVAVSPTTSDPVSLWLPENQIYDLFPAGAVLHPKPGT